MLKNISIENVAVIEKADISFTDGLNILTGETGAGKSIVIDSINAILGERTTRDIIRNGTQKAVVSALFEDVGKEVEKVLAELGIECEEDGSLLINRVISSDGKGSCRINGQNATASMLKAIAGELINIHGQHDSQKLLNPTNHGVYIDKMADTEKSLEEYLKYYNLLRSIRKQINDLTVNEEEKKEKIDTLKYQIEEIESAELKEGELEQLNERKGKILNAEKITSALNNAYALLNGTEDVQGVVYN
ncbi:MAG: AAA family ATPase, partial [Clostridiales bacterium]|nr:AAA family ATPase [Clostridiales bacterium]